MNHFRLALWLVSSIPGFWETSLPAQVAGAAIGPATAGVSGIQPGELLLGELNCVACHDAEAGVKNRLASRQSVRLGMSGLRLTPQYLRSFLSHPFSEKPGTTMPDLLHALDGTQKAEAVEALVHFLYSLASTNASAAVSANPTQILQGRLLYHQVGCVACHAPQEPVASLAAKTSLSDTAPGAFVTPMGESWKTNFENSSVPLGNLAKKTTVEELAKFLSDPLKVRPSGRMPSLNLTEPEATAIAMYLLRDQATATDPARPLQRTKGLGYEYFEGNFADMTALDAAKPKASGFAGQFSLLPRQRVEHMGLRFNGFVSVPADGQYTFYTASDDGTRLSIDGRLVVDNDGHHSTVEKSGTIQLMMGEHPIQVSYFNNDGGFALKVSYQGPGLRKQEIPAAALSHMALPMLPLEEEVLTVDLAKAARGHVLFASLGCAACHELGDRAIASASKAKPLSDLDPNAPDNCLNTTPQKAASYLLSGSQREAIRTTLVSRQGLDRLLAAQEQITRTMAALNCFACHSRDSASGPSPHRAEYFTVSVPADLGDEGRLPPHLTRVGDKLRADWLRQVLISKGAARPYMATRMPQFGEANVGPLLEAFVKADSSGRRTEETDTPRDSRNGLLASSATDANYGRKLVGAEGLSCIACHTFAGHKSLGIPAMDLALMTRRLQKSWFHRYLLDPPSLRPGTRMPAFWPEGQTARKDILDGDTSRQIDAVWAYLARGNDGGLPPGLIQGKMELAATNEALIYRHFIQGAGTRAIGVAYPEKANLAFDAHDLRLALIWQGPFIDAARHRTGRGEGFEGPLGYNEIKMPPGPSFAILADTGSKWPEISGKKADHQMHGYQLDGKRRPAFLYSFENIQIEDYPIAVAGDLEASMRRTLTLEADRPVTNLWFRAWLGSIIEAQPDGSFLADGKIKLQFEGSGAAKPIIRQSDRKFELLVPVRFEGHKTKIVEQIFW